MGKIEDDLMAGISALTTKVEHETDALMLSEKNTRDVEAAVLKLQKARKEKGTEPR